MKLHPQANFVLLKKAKVAERVGSLFIPEKHRSKVPIGEVLEVGPDCKRTKVGEKVYFNQGGVAGAIPVTDVEGLLLVVEDSILAIVEGEVSDILTEGIVSGILRP